jgi:tetratricopeptide (TPR) repeat protein
MMGRRSSSIPSRVAPSILTRKVERMKHCAALAILALLWGACAGWALAGDLRHDLLQRKEYDAAIAECTRRITSGEGNRQDTAYSYWVRGYAYLGKGERENALVDYGRAIELDPTPDRYYERGELYQAMSRYDEALADFQKALQLYEARHDSRNDRYDAQAARSKVRIAAKRREYDTWASVILLCCIGYLVLKEVRRPRKIFDGRSTKASRIALLLSVTLLPLLVFQGLNLLGWSLRFVSVFRTVLVAGMVVAVGAAIIALLAALWKRRKQHAGPAGALAPAGPPADGASDQGPQGNLPSEERRYCPHCGTAVFAMEDIRFCHNCGASLNGLWAKAAGSLNEGGKS